MKEYELRKPKLFQNVLSLDHCKLLEKNILYFAENMYSEVIKKKYDDAKSVNHVDSDAKFNWSSLNHPYMAFKSYDGFIMTDDQLLNDLIYDLTQLMSDHYKENIIFHHAHLRLYKKDSVLLRHFDNEDLDITLSVNVGGLENWPLNISKEEMNRESDQYESYITPLGSGVSCYGRKYVHWRDKLECKENEYVTQMFYHWTIID